MWPAPLVHYAYSPGKEEVMREEPFSILGAGGDRLAGATSPHVPVHFFSGTTSAGGIMPLAVSIAAGAA